ncbi:Crp/Fnr family transcriptional regulator [Algimonas porphyrae]|uniref:Crp/Fnr family transcriptional regulator n=1 Tax=Algimonas porphyrae TaxID=1128113 RepID=A0ABQ5V1J0_9PROT|nr:Crp/Fnr family transcriptional regulator [Algimonas porphyrae]GLQ20451.1 Crp/Fnr family transcriptional regulator [Algimonas porphyrae]
MGTTRQSLANSLVEPASFRKLAALSDISREDLQALSSMPYTDIAVGRNRSLIDPLNDPLKCFVVATGWAYSFAVMPNGRRQVFHIYQEGDLIGFEDLMFSRNVFPVTAITNCRLANIRTDQMRSFLSRNVRLSSYLYAMSNLNQVVLMDRMQAIARLEPKPRMAHFLLELMSRTRVTSDFHNGRRGRSMVFNLPMRQGLIADCAGMSAVHVSRTLSWFVEDGLISRPARHIFEVHDEQRLLDMSGFKNRYETITRMN